MEIERGGYSRRSIAALVAVAGLFAVAVVLLGPGDMASGQGSFDGTYTGTFSGNATFGGGSSPVSGEVEFTVITDGNGSHLTVTKPGEGSGELDQSDISMVVGNANVGGFSCQFQATGTPVQQGSGEVFASGNWQGTCSNGATGSGTWQAARPAVTPTPTPTSEPIARSLALKAKPKVLDEPGRTTLTGTLSYCTATSAIEFLVKKAGAFETLKSVVTGEDCKASMKRRVTRKTTFQAVTQPGGGYGAASSQPLTVKINR